MRALGKALLEIVFVFAVAPLLLIAELLALWFADLIALLVSKKPPENQTADDRAVSVVIPTWNGRHHLEANLPSVVEALAGGPRHEIIVVDNASSDGTAGLLAERFPGVRVLAQETNLGFGGGSNAGFHAAKNGIVVLLNNDMRVEPDFLAPLVEGFADEQVFAVSAQIFFSDPNKRREETGLTSGRWAQGRLILSHIADEQVRTLFPAFYAGGGSTAYDRRKFLEIGGFDPVLHPFYMEDADTSYLAWKRGWKVLYAPGSVVYHEHRGTIGRHFSEAAIERIVHKNNLLFVWKNIHEPGRLAGHFGWLWLAMLARIIAGPSPTRPSSRALLAAFSQTPGACRSRIAARRLSAVDDTEALRRPLGGYFRDRFAPLDAEPRPLNVLFVSPYGMSPPIHGGGVFMNQTVRHLAKLCRLHLLCLVDEEAERDSNVRFGAICASAEVVQRWSNHSHAASALRPHAAQHFWHPDFEWLLHRIIHQRAIDAVQLEYTQLAVYAADFRRIAAFLFEHDIYFQSVWRGMRGETSALVRAKRLFEYLRALRFERQCLAKFDEIQVCTRANREYLESYAWKSPPVLEGLRAGIDAADYKYVEEGREPNTALFVGNFKHPPNRAALEWFVRKVFPLLRERRPQARLIAVGAQAPPSFEESLRGPGIEFRGRVDDIHEPLRRYAVFLAPILSGSGVRVKLLEAFASGIPAVATSLGAEGLTRESGTICELADTPAEFAGAVARLLEDGDYARRLARQAREEVVQNWDMARITRRLAGRYAEKVREKRVGFKSPPTGRLSSTG